MGETVNSIANRLLRTRLALGFDEQVDFCKEIGVKKNVYNPFEKGSRRISLNVAVKIRDRFVDKGITLDWIYCGDATRISSKLYRDIVNAA